MPFVLGLAQSMLFSAPVVLKDIPIAYGQLPCYSVLQSAIHTRERDP